MKIEDLDPDLHQPVRTRIMTYLLRDGESDFVTLKKDLNLTDGHMTTHMRVLTESGLIDVKKEFVNNKPRTTYKVSKDGKKRFIAYLDVLKKMIEEC
jgi:predicted ArsR family transcriptional regulator